DVDLKAARGPHHDHAKTIFGTEELGHHNAEDGTADRQAQADDDIGQRIRDNHQAGDAPFRGPERPHDIDQDPVGVAHPFISIDQDRKQGADEYDHDL